jgi:hypothetical protein
VIEHFDHFDVDASREGEDPVAGAEARVNASVSEVLAQLL